MQDAKRRRLLPLRQHPKNRRGLRHGRVVNVPPPPLKQNQLKLKDVPLLQPGHQPVGQNVNAVRVQLP